MNVLARMVVATSALVLAVGCAGQGSTPPGSEQAQRSAGQPISTPSTSTQSPNKPPLPEPVEPSEKTISARINDGKVEGVPARFEVDRGTRVRIDVTSDRNDEVHVHGYDKTVPLAAGSPATVAFVADQPGVFEVETHDSGLLLFQLVVRE